MLESAVLAGVLIGIGDIALVKCDNRYIGAFLFAVALLSIIKLKLPLYTGRIGRVIKDKTYFDCLVYLVFNMLGTLIPLCWLVINDFDELSKISAIKFSKSILELIFAGVLCGILIHVAVTAQSTILTILCVMTFIVCGFEHCIADVPFILGSSKSILEIIFIFVSVVIGNTIGGIVTELCIGDRI